jgi:hypothetical protein
MNRREFIGSMAGAAAQAYSPIGIEVRSDHEESFKRRLAQAELRRGLQRLGGSQRPAPGVKEVLLTVEPGKYKSREGYSISMHSGILTLSGAGEQALLYSVFDFLERQGVFFGIDGESYPLDGPPQLVLPPENQPWEAAPRFEARGLLPWPDFLNCISVYNGEDFQAYFDSMLRMRFNTFGMHVYTGANQWAESYLSFEFAGAGHLAFLDTTATNRWGYLPQKTSRFTMGAADFYDGEVFGSDATRLGRGPWETAELTRSMLQKAFAYAAKLGIRTGIGFELYQIPDEILRALPPEARRPDQAGSQVVGPRFDIESVTARDMLETRLAQLLEAYPEVDYVWLWEDEQMNWDSRKANEPLSVTPFLQAHGFLRRHAPEKKLVVSGWGGVSRHFESFHKRLPMDIVFACLSDSLGWDPINEVFGKLEGRERWPIPWLEDDPSMWLPQFHVHRFERDMDLAEKYGCQGLIGIHWRHRIVDPTAGYQARFSWDRGLKPADYYRAYANAQAAEDRASRLAETLTAADGDRKLLSTWTGEIKDGHAVTREYSGDYNEAFTYWNDYEPEPAILQSQKEVAQALRSIAEAATTSAERERLDYLAGHVEFLVPYSEAWVLAHRIHGILQEAGELKRSGSPEEAKEKVRSGAVPLWLRLAPQAREAVLCFQRVACTRNDLGTLASMHNKLVRLALYRLPLSIKEYLGDTPPEIRQSFAEATRRDDGARGRVFIPTRPTLLTTGESVRISIVALEAGDVSLSVRVAGSSNWKRTGAKLTGRKTYEAVLGPFSGGEGWVEYFASAGSRQSPVYAATVVQMTSSRS